MRNCSSARCKTRWVADERLTPVGFDYNRGHEMQAGRRALRRGAELAILLNAHAHVLSIVPSGIHDPFLVAGATGHACIVDDAMRRYQRMVDESVQWLKARGVTAEGYLSSGNTIDQITAYTKRLNIDLIVLGHYPQPSGGLWWTGSQ